MKIQQLKAFVFKAMPKNYAKVDNYISRSAQPNKEDFLWLKEQGVTDIINFRTMCIEKIDFDEPTEVKNAGMRYHNIPSRTKEPRKDNIIKFLDLIESIKAQSGKAHIHCMAGADRTGMYAFIYKAINGIGTLVENEKEWLALGHDVKLFPNLRAWTKDFVKNLK